MHLFADIFQCPIINRAIRKSYESGIDRCASLKFYNINAMSTTKLH